MMRRHDKEITDRASLLAVLDKCAVCHLAFHDGAYPYTIPVNCAYGVAGEAIELYFHCANQGKKLELLKKNNKVAFSMRCGEGFVPGATPCGDTYAYQSVCGTGDVEFVTDGAEKRVILQRILRHLGDDRELAVSAELAGLTVCRIRVGEMTGKQSKGL